MVEIPSCFEELSMFSMKELAIFGFLESREDLTSKVLTFLSDSFSSYSSETLFLNALTRSYMVMSSLFFVTAFLIMGALQWGQRTCLFASFLSNYCRQGMQQLCWFMHIIMGAQSPLSNSPMHKKHSNSILSLSRFSIYLVIPLPVSSSLAI